MHRRGRGPLLGKNWSGPVRPQLYVSGCFYVISRISVYEWWINRQRSRVRKAAGTLRKGHFQTGYPANRPHMVRDSDFVGQDQALTNMTKAERIKEAARKTIVQLKALQRLLDSLVKSKPAPKVRPKRKKSVKREPVARKREKRPEDYDEALWDFVANWEQLGRLPRIRPHWFSREIYRIYRKRYVHL